MPTLEVRLLGRIEVTIDGTRVTVPGRRPQALLAVLALSAGEPVPAEALHERVFGRDLPGDVRANLYTCVRRLRKALGEDAIHNDAGRYALRVDPEDVDAVRFTRLLDRARAAGADPEPLLREALGLWQGAPFGDERISDWLAENESRRLTERWLAAVQQRIDLDLAAGRCEGLVEELEQLTAAYSLREPLWVRYLQALDRAGRPADALAAYERIRLQLADELGIDPSPELQSVYANLLRGEAPRAAGAAMATTEVPRQLPSDVAAFTGRDDALAELDRLLATAGGSGVFVVHGLGGMGKTALAVRWAHRVADRYPDGQLFVNLRGYAPGAPMEPTAALDILLRGLSVPGDRIPADVDARSGLWRSTAASKRLLLILDNARDAEQVRPLLPGAGCLVLVTNRTSLRGLAAREGARAVHLAALPERDALALLRARLGGTADAEALVQLASLCGNLPLALTVAAERVHRHLSLALLDVVIELRDEQDRLDAFADPDDALADVRAVFSWSFTAVGPDATRLLGLLALAPSADIGLDAAAALAGEPTGATRRILHRLTDASLVTATAAGRYEVHDLVRAYAVEQAREQLSADERELGARRLYHWCLGTATNAGRTTRPQLTILHPDNDVPGAAALEFGGDAAAASAWLDQETDFLIAVAQAAAPSYPWATIGITSGLWDHNRWTRSWSEVVVLMQLTIRAARAVDSPAAEARAANGLGIAYLRGGDYGAAIPALTQALELARRLGNVLLEGHVLSNLGSVIEPDDPAASIPYRQQALELGQRHGLAQIEALARNNLAVVYSRLSQHDRAGREARISLDLYRSLGQVISQAMALDTLATALHGVGNDDAAIECLTEAMQLCQEPVIARPLSLVMAGLARIQLAAGRRAEAAETLRSAVALMDEYDIIDDKNLTRAELVHLLVRATTNADESAPGSA